VFLHKNPYAPFIHTTTTKLIVGTLPPPRFTTKTLKPDDVHFCYGSNVGLLWPTLDKIFNLHLKFENSEFAISQRKKFLIKRKIGVCDIVASAEREKIDASDIGMRNIILRDVISVLEKNSLIDTILFTGGNSKNGPEYFFRKHLKEYNCILELVNNNLPRIHQFDLPISKRKIKTVSLIAPSGAANRAIGSLKQYKISKSKNPLYTTLDFRMEQYKKFF
jgi:G:T/U-mismatch repair DNA glycosylase